MRRALACVALLSLISAAQAQDPSNDVILRAMQDELGRSRQLRMLGMDAPYFFEYRVEDASVLVIGAMLGALVTSNQTAARVAVVRVRVGDYQFDNANHVYSDFYTGTRYDSDRLPQDNSYPALRQSLWLATDRVYKTAEEAIARKRSALKNVMAAEKLPDFSKAEPVKALLPVKRVLPDEAQWKARVVRLSGVFGAYSQVLSSTLEFQAVQSTDYLVNSEGSEIRVPENLAYVRIRAFGQAPDGMWLRDAGVFQAFDVNGLPVEAELRRGTAEIAEEIAALTAAPQGEGYDGPVLFEARAASQLFGQLLGDNLKIGRKPVSEPGRAAPFLPSELENRVGARVLPDWMDVVDDPTQTEWRGQTLFGHYLYDMEGVAPKPLALIEHGVLKSFLLSRTPALKGFESSNGRGRMPGPFGTASAGYGNLFVKASGGVPAAELKKKLLDLVKQRNKPYGLLVRKLDWPSSASLDELRRSTSAMAQSGGGTRPVSLPLLVYRVYPDGREELVRGMRFRGLSSRSLRDIAAASDENYVFNFLDTPVTFALMGVGGFVTNASVIAPAVLFEELELEKSGEELLQLPVVPPPPLAGAR
ncbi:MAG: metallopeptidase TldD-related protein [Acidobacteriota bacterium]|nr:metallopeptidase TldD-related protein [Acidobacteriota bacterium]